MKGEVGVAIDSNYGICTIKIGDGVHHWQDLSLELGQKNYYPPSHSYARGDYSISKNTLIKPSGYSHAEGAQSIVCGHSSHAEGYQSLAMEKAMEKIQHAASAVGISTQQATEAIRNIMQAVNSNNNTLQELANYIDNQKVTTIETREEPARSQPKDLRSELKTPSRAFEEYNLTEVHSDIDFDF